MVKIAIVYHRTSGHTKFQSGAVHRGAQSFSAAPSAFYTVEEATARVDELDAADAIIFGCPTYMRSMSAGTFLEAAAEKWFTLAWKEKVPGPITNSSFFSGEKLNTLVGVVINAMQHGTIFVGPGTMPSNNRPEEIKSVNCPGPEAQPTRIFHRANGGKFSGQSTGNPNKGRHRDRRGLRSAGCGDYHPIVHGPPGRLKKSLPRFVNQLNTLNAGSGALLKH
jgi:NAD(P)H dehydrogenase (quinone)